MENIDFKSISLEDCEKIKSYLQTAAECGYLPKICDYAFANLFLWRELYNSEYAYVDNFIVFRQSFRNKNCHYYLEPIPVTDLKNINLYEISVKNVIEKLQIFSANLNEPFCISFMSLEFANILQRIFDDKFFIYKDRNYFNYIYSANALFNLSGKKLQPKRNHVHQFIAENPDYITKPLTEFDYTKAILLCECWEKSKENYLDANAMQMLLAEKSVIKEAFAHYKELKLEGLFLLVRSGNEYKPVAFTFGSKLTKDCFCTHIEKASPECKNAFAMINKLFANALKDKFIYINREEDLGIEGLRKAKLSYHPETLTETYFALNKSSEEYKIWSLWKEAFGDSDEFLAEYMQIFSTKNARITIYDDSNQNLLAMAHVHYFYMNLKIENVYGRIKVGYIYALATATCARKKGLGTKVVQMALDKLKKNDCILAWTIQGNLSYNAWETCLGFFAPNMQPFDLDFCDAKLQLIFGADSLEQRALVRVLDNAREGEIKKALIAATLPFKLEKIKAKE